jgi:hypothetical protein
MRWLLFSIVQLLALPAAQPHKAWVVRSDSRIHIVGKSNVANFQCDATRYEGQDTLLLREPIAGGRAFFDKGTVRMPVLQFDCHNLIMTGDFRRTLHAKQHPYLIIRFLHLDHMPALGRTCENITGRLEVTLAGAVKEFEMTFQLEPGPDNTLHLYGRRRMAFSHFNLEPPQKMMGLVRVEDGLTVEFTMRLKTL